MEDPVLIRLRDLRRAFDGPAGRTTVLDGIDLDIPAGSFTVIRGASGAGKTTLVRYLMQALGTTQDVSSPTFAIANEYVPQNGPWQGVYHLDLYRLRSLDEVRALPLSDYTESGYLCLIEWPQIAADELPEDTKVLRIEAMENGSRKIVFL